MSQGGDLANKNRGRPVNLEVQVTTNNVAWDKHMPRKSGGGGLPSIQWPYPMSQIIRQAGGVGVEMVGKAPSKEDVFLVS